MDTWLLTCTGSQVAPLSVLEKISRGVMVNNVFGGPTVMARLWMSGSVTPLVTTSHVLPPSLLCRTPSTSRPAQMCWWSTGSTTRVVTLGMPTLGHSSAICTDSLSQCSPPSVERNSAAGLVPAKIMLGSTGSMARAQMGISFMGESSRSQCSPLSSPRYTPLSAPQYMIRASLGLRERARCVRAEGHRARQPGERERQPAAPRCARAAESPRVATGRDHGQGGSRHGNARPEIEATDTAVVGHAVDGVVITRRTRHA